MYNAYGKFFHFACNNLYIRNSKYNVSLRKNRFIVAKTKCFWIIRKSLRFTSDLQCYTGMTVYENKARFSYLSSALTVFWNNQSGSGLYTSLAFAYMHFRIPLHKLAVGSVLFYWLASQFCLQNIWFWYFIYAVTEKSVFAIGSASYPKAGTTNLHLDISDATNVMVRT